MDVMNFRHVAAASAALSLGGCSSTPADLEAKTAPVVTSYSDNYQEIYRRVSTTAKRCFAGNIGAHASMAVDADLYSDLGYGEINTSLINWGTRNYYWTARIERNGTGSKMILRSGNTLASERTTGTVLGWANGGSDCPLI
jgi:hypothetical protein